MTRLTIAAVMCLFLASTALAQTPIPNPTFVEFTVSADHNRTLPDGRPQLTSYEIRFFAAGATDPMSRSTLGKPTAADGATVRLAIDTLLIAFPVDPGVTYTAKVAALGPGGEEASAASNPFFLVVAGPRAPSGVTIGRP